MVLSAHTKQRIIQLYLARKISYGRIAEILKAEGLKASKKSVWMTVQRYQSHGMTLRKPGSGRPFKLRPEILKIIEDRLNEDDETTAVQLKRMLGERGYNVSKQTIIRARKILG